jgi:hypothetical protein
MGLSDASVSVVIAGGDIDAHFVHTPRCGVAEETHHVKEVLVCCECKPRRLYVVRGRIAMEFGAANT